jgi:hypothetical protein
MKKLSIIFLCILLVLLLFGCSNAKQENVTTTVERTTVAIDDYVSFSCTGDEFILPDDDGSLKYSDTVEFKCSDTVESQSDGTSLVVNVNGEETPFYYTGNDFKIASFIDGALFVVENDNTLLRLKIYIYDDSIHLGEVTILLDNTTYTNIVKAQKNELILSNGSNYISFDTQTGTSKEIQYDYAVDYDSNICSINKEQAIEIAEQYATNVDLYKDYISDIETKDINIEKIEEIELVCKPNLISRPYVEDVKEMYPEYAWRIVFQTTGLRAIAYVDAVNGEIAHFYLDFLD